MKPSRIILLVGLVLVLVFVASNLWAFAEVDGASIHACVGRWGRIRIVPNADCCRRYEKHFEWNIQGPQGEPGPPGIAGELEIYTVESDQQEVLPDTRGEVSAECEAGDQIGRAHV